MAITQNQTPQKAREMVGADANTVGCGVFVVPDPKKVGGGRRGELIGDLTYTECEKRGANCITWKFLPEALISFAKVEEAIVLNAPCKGNCPCTNPNCYCDDARLCMSING